jgi:hypothetical protein
MGALGSRAEAVPIAALDGLTAEPRSTGLPGRRRRRGEAGSEGTHRRQHVTITL